MRKRRRAQRKRKAEEDADDAERAERERAEPVHEEGGGQKRKAEEEADDKERADREEDDKWADYCAVERIDEIEEEDARRWVCDLSRVGLQEKNEEETFMNEDLRMKNGHEYDQAWDIEDVGDLDLV